MYVHTSICTSAWANLNFAILSGGDVVNAVFLLLKKK